MANQKHIKDRRLLWALLVSISLIQVQCNAHLLPIFNNDDNYQDEYGNVDEAALRDYYLSTRADGSELASTWSQFKDYLRRQGLTPQQLATDGNVFDEPNNDNVDSNSNSNLDSRTYYDSLSPFEPIKTLQQPLLSAEQQQQIQNEQAKDTNYKIVDSAAASDDNDFSAVAYTDPLIATDSSPISSLSSLLNTKDSTTKTTNTQDNAHHDEDIDSESNASRVYSTGNDRGISSNSNNEPNINKRQAPVVISSYATALKSFALQVADQFKNLWSSSKSGQNASNQNVTDKTTKISLKPEYNASSEADVVAELPTPQPSVAHANAAKQVVNSQQQHHQAEAEKRVDSQGAKWNYFRNSEQFAAPLAPADEMLAVQPQPSSLLGRYLYAPTNHFHFDLGKQSSGEQHEQLSAQNSQVEAAKRLVGGHRRYHSMDDDLDSTIEALNDKPTRKTIIEVTKGNDLYFVMLVMGLCATATTIVLGLGFFAFKMHQNRKLGLDDEPPSYGVVGPNSIAATVGKSAGGNLAANYLIGTQAGAGLVLPADSLKQLGTLDVARHELSAKLSNNPATVDANQPVCPQQQAANGAGHRALYLSNQNAAMYHYQHQKQQMISSTGDHNAAGHNTSASDLESEDDNDDENYTVYECPGLASAHNMEIKNPLFHDDQTPVNSPSFARKE